MTEEQYTLEFTDEARKDLQALEKPVKKRILNKLKWLTLNVSIFSHEALKGKYRIIYALYHDRFVILVIEIGHRREVYK
jgi:mRNA interferase RelE/StbE